MKKIILTLVLSTLILLKGFSQETGMAESYQPSKTQFMIRGYAHAGFEYKKVGDDIETTYVGSSFAPLFIFRHSDKILFESELQFSYVDNELEIDFEYANLSYLLNDYMTIRMGKFLLPFGTFVERLHPAWINKLSNAPLGFGHDGITPASGVGIEIRGAIPMGGAKLLYYVYSTNGPRLNTGESEPEEAGLLHFDNINDNNNNKAIGGRIGLIPFSNSALEVGASVYSGVVGDRNSGEYENTSALLTAYDISYVRQVSALRGILDIKAQFNSSKVDNATYYEIEPGDTVATSYTFDNNSSAYFAQLSYRPSMAANAVLKNFEVVGRYSTLQTPEGAEWEVSSKQWTVGLNYWLNWRTVFKLNYQQTTSEGGHDAAPGEQTITDGLFVHWALGF